MSQQIYNKFSNNLKDLTGQKFGRLLVLYRGENDKTGHTRWYCLCECGKECLVYKDALLNDRQRSCGCLKDEISRIPKGKTQNQYDLSGEYGIGITHNTKREFYFDLEDYDKIKGYCWREDCNGYIITNKNKNTMLLLHRVVTNTNDPTYDVDHIQHNLYDNRKEKLRVILHRDNLKNHKLQSNNQTGYSGVWHDKKKNKWESYISVNKKRIHLGKFDNFEDAVKARKDAEEKYFGEYSYDNSMKL